MKLSRRAAFAGLALAPTAAFAATTAEVDPIFAAIKAHREAIKAWEHALHVEQNHPWQEAHFKAMRAEMVKDSPDGEEWDPPKPKDFLDLEEGVTALGDREIAAQDELVTTMAATLPGALAVIRYVIAYYTGESELYPGRIHPLLDDDAVLNLLDRIGDAIEAAIGRNPAGC